MAMIKKKCMTCGTLHSLDHATECIVCDENYWGITCDKHQKIKLNRNSSCPECKAEEEASKRVSKTIEKKSVNETAKKAAIKKAGDMAAKKAAKKALKIGATREAAKKAAKAARKKAEKQAAEIFAGEKEYKKPTTKRKKKAKKPPKPPLKPHRGGTILFLGVISIFLCWCSFLTGIPAWLMGKSDLAEMDRGAMEPSGRRSTNIGRIIGKVVTIFWITIIALKNLGEIF
jgi:hypothetical protein